MSLASTRNKVQGAYKDLRLRWEKARAQWDDPRSRAFEEDFIEPLEPRVRAAAAAMDEMNELMTRAVRDCSDQGGV
jgi:hypothetical protein